MEAINKKGIISRKEYEWLKQFNNLTEGEQEKLKEFEKANPVEVKPLPEKQPKPKREKVVLTKSIFWGLFKKFYFQQNKKDFIQTQDTLENLKPVLLYFAKDPGFFEAPRLVKQAGGVKLNPSFNKGLLIFGNYGNGKTSIMTAFEIFMKQYRIPGWFKGYKSHELVTEYEGLETPYDRKEFYNKHGKHQIYIDDVKKEKMASNFGKVDVIRELLEKRYDNKAITHITCNQPEGESYVNIESTLAEFGERYGGHIYDRLFEMFNIIEFKGKSFRV